MPITTSLDTVSTKTTNTHRIYASYTPGLSRRELQAKLADLAARGGITLRDERLLELLRELNVLSLNQIHRLLWPPDSQEEAARRRLSSLVRHHLLDRVRAPRDQMKGWQLSPGLAYTLGPGGRIWLQEQVDGKYATHLKRNQVLHDLLVAELYVGLVEAILPRGENWHLSWAGEQAASFYKKQESSSPLVAPDGLTIIRKQEETTIAELAFFVEMDASREAHGRPSSDWGRKVHGYDRFYAGQVWQHHPEVGKLQAFPLLLVVTHSERRLLNLVEAIAGHRQQPVVYYLALWEDLAGTADITTVPAWLIITPNGKIVGQNPDRRRPLMKAESC